MHRRHECRGLPVLQNTKLGYILSGKIHQCYVKRYKNQCQSFFVQTESLHHLTEWFWSIEEMNSKILTKEERACEEHFQLHTRRLDTGIPNFKTVSSKKTLAQVMASCCGMGTASVYLDNSS